MMLQVAENMLWVWGESGPASFIDAAAKQPAVTRVSIVSTWGHHGCNTESVLNSMLFIMPE